MLGLSDALETGEVPAISVLVASLCEWAQAPDFSPKRVAYAQAALGEAAEALCRSATASRAHDVDPSSCDTALVLSAAGSMLDIVHGRAVHASDLGHFVGLGPSRMRQIARDEMLRASCEVPAEAALSWLKSRGLRVAKGSA